MRHAACLALLLAIPTVLAADDSDDTLAFYLRKSELVVVGKVLNEPVAFSTEAGVDNYVTELAISDVLKGPDVPRKLTVNIVRFTGTGGVPKKDANYIVFLRSVAPNKPDWQTADFWFGIMPHNDWIARSLKRTAEEQARVERWRPLRELGDARRPEDIPKLIEIADNSQRDVALAAISSLSSFRPTPEIVKFLIRKMDDEDPHVALEAAIVSCYSGDWSGFDMLLAHVDHEDAELRREAIGQLVDTQFRGHAKRIVPRLLARLKVETEPAMIDRTLESLSSYPEQRVRDAVAPFLKHPSERVSTRAQIAMKRLGE